VDAEEEVAECESNLPFHTCRGLELTVCSERAVLVQHDFGFGHDVRIVCACLGS
jgi:hypothetical protein